MSERLQHVEYELSSEVVQHFAATFLSRWDKYPVQRKESRLYTQVEAPLTLDMVRQHLTGWMGQGGALTLGAYALSADSMAKWLCFDADEPQRWERLHQVARTLREQQVPSYLELSRAGGHLWLFPAVPLSGVDARRAGLQLAQQFELEGIELYPKQAQLPGGPEHPGSFVRLPFGLHQFSRKVYHFADGDGTPLAPTLRAQIAMLAHPDRVASDFFTSLLSSAPPLAVPSPTLPFEPREKPRKHDWNEPLSARLKHLVSVREFVGQYVVLDSTGWGRCPFHNDEHDSFGVNEGGNYWSCQACRIGGTIVDFWMHWRAKEGKDGSFTATVVDLKEMLL